MGLASALTPALVLAASPALGLRPPSIPAPTVQAEPPRTVEQKAEPPKSEARKPAPPRKPIAGLSAVESISTLVFPASPDRPHRLSATYVFPDRVRWQLSLPGEKLGAHEIRYRYGEEVYQLPEQASRSQACLGEERRTIVLAMELRRALLLYPDGFAWEDSKGERRADLGALGSLYAISDSPSDARPKEIGSREPSGETVDAFREIVWRPADGRTWPASAELWHGGVLEFRETIVSIDVAGRYVDSYFLPADRRDVSPSSAVVETAKTIEIPAVCSLRVEVPKGTGWSDAVSNDAKARAEWIPRLRESGFSLDRRATIEVDDQGVPLATILRLETVPDKPPTGFVTAPARKGISIAVPGLAAVSGARIDGLSKSIPSTSSRGKAYVRFDPGEAPAGTVLIVVPYAPPRDG